MKDQKIFVKSWELQQSEEFEKNHEFWLSLDERGKLIHSQGTEAADRFSSMEDPKKVFKKHYN